MRRFQCRRPTISLTEGRRVSSIQGAFIGDDKRSAQFMARRLDDGQWQINASVSGLSRIDVSTGSLDPWPAIRDAINKALDGASEALGAQRRYPAMRMS